jgi:hypothetical protein
MLGRLVVAVLAAVSLLSACGGGRSPGASSRIDRSFPRSV